MRNGRLFIWLIVLALVAGGGAFGWRRFGASPQVTVAEARRGSVAEVVYATGVVAVLDSRMATARYGAYLRASLPPFWTTTDPEQVRAALRRLCPPAAG